MTKRKLVKLLAKRYKMMASILILLAAGLLLLPDYKKSEKVKPEELLSEVISPERYINSDKLAEKLVGLDPSILLLDVRSKKEYDKYSLPNSLNMPLDSILTSTADGFINQDQFDIVLYSNDNFLADQVWIFAKRMGGKNLFVLKGGLNNWFKTIIDPKEPQEIADKTNHDLFAFRQAAGRFFGVGDDLGATKKKKKRKIVIRKKKKKKAEGGC